MIIICCICKKEIGKKEPLESTLISHSYCEDCAKKEFKKIDKMPIGPTIERLITTRIDIWKK